ncbi:MAG TPA: methyltransferase domain-containing protein [Rhabdochlamydiaceae bacterium]|nr:methyltransferase domain-containing protein [Rhabdochlamydiaceae bacterium]
MSWENVAKWYDKSVGEKGQYYHQKVIIPNLLRLLEPNERMKLLDLGCGQAVLSRALPEKATYLGIDASETLIKAAKKRATNKNHHFIVKDLTHPLDLPQKEFTHAVFLLSLQNMPEGSVAIKNARDHMEKGGKLLLVLNHPCFRVPRQSSWEIDPQKKLRYRRIDRYMTPLDVPIKAHPGKEKSEETISFHYPLSKYIEWLHNAGFLVEGMEEWCSDKVSSGKTAKMENFSRREFPLFLTIIATS